MITAFVLVLLFGGSFGSSTSLNLSDPEVMARFTQSVSGIVKDPGRATAVTNASFRLNVLAWQSRSAESPIRQNVRQLRFVLGDYDASRDEIIGVLGSIGSNQQIQNGNTIEGREVIRRNTTKREWGRLLKELSE